MNGHVVLALLETLISCLGAQNPILNRFGSGEGGPLDLAHSDVLT